MSRRGKILIILDLIVLTILAVVGGAWLMNQDRNSTGQTASSFTPMTPLTTTPPFQTSHGLAWVTAACGTPMPLDEEAVAQAGGGDWPSNLVPRAADWAICLTPPPAPPVVVSVYNNRSALNEDLASKGEAHHYAIRTDDSGQTWLFLVEGADASSLVALERYGFDVN